MTSSGPYTTATLSYEPLVDMNLGIIPAQNTLLHWMYVQFPYYLNIVEKAGMLAFYNGPLEKPYTVFITPSRPIDIDSMSLARTICRSQTVEGNVSLDALRSSPHMFLKTLSPTNNIVIKYYGDTRNLYANTARITGSIICKNGTIHLLDTDLWPTKW